MLAPLETLTQLQARVAELADQLPWTRDGGLASLILELPAPPKGIPDIGGPMFHLEHPHKRTLRAGFGMAAEYRAQGPGCLERLRSQLRPALADWWRLDPDDTGFDAFAWIGFAATLDSAETPAGATPPALCWVPEIGLQCLDGQCVLVLSTRLPASRDGTLARWLEQLARLVPALALPAPGPLTPACLRRGEELPERGDWDKLVGEALQAIDDGVLTKVVAARRLRLVSERRLDAGRLATALTYLFPSCQMLRWRFDDAAFVAATPERLLSLRGRRVEVDALAGTAGRAAPAARDAELAEALLASAKDRHEHDLVVRDIVDSLAPISASLQVPDQPGLLQLTNAQHLWTPVFATLREDDDVLGLAQRLHPTPAVNGVPRIAARTWLNDREPFARGWYTGAAGWVGPDLGGDLWVLLRCAELSGHRADLYAGAGLVAGSDAASEWQETEDKFAAMLTALQFA